MQIYGFRNFIRSEGANPEAKLAWQSKVAKHWAASSVRFDAQLSALLGRTPSRPQPAPGERVYAVGDVHGRLDLLRKLLRSLDKDSNGHAHFVRTVFLGDMIDRGPQSKQVLELVRCLQRKDPERIVALLGNHEEMMLASLNGDAEAQRIWLKSGGEAFLRSYNLDPETFSDLGPGDRGRALRTALGADMIDWLQSRPLAWQSGDYFFCHAGVRPGVPLKRQRREDLLWIRRPFLESECAHGAVIVHGHSETHEAEVTPNRINVDTAAHRSGELTAVGLQGRCRWFMSTTRTYLNRPDLDMALARTQPSATQALESSAMSKRLHSPPSSRRARFRMERSTA